MNEWGKRMIRRTEGFFGFQWPPDPLGSPRHPLVVYLLALALFSGLSELFGASTSGAVEAALHDSTRDTWAFILALGSAAALAGMFWPGDRRTGLVLKRLGYAALTVAASIYCLIVLLTVGQAGLSVGLVIFGFGVACGIIARRVDKTIRSALR